MRNQIRRLHVEPRRELLERPEAEVACAPLDVSDVVPMQPGAIGELILGDPESAAEIAHCATERDVCLRLLGHGAVNP